MRHDAHSRTIKVRKDKLIEQIKANKAKHQKEYAEAVEAFKREAAKRIAQLQTDLDSGTFNKIHLSMTPPENRSDEYDKLVIQFEWEIADEVELSQGEFNEYIHDETSFARQAKLSNSTYLGR